MLRLSLRREKPPAALTIAIRVLCGTHFSSPGEGRRGATEASQGSAAQRRRSSDGTSGRGEVQKTCHRGIRLHLQQLGILRCDPASKSGQLPPREVAAQALVALALAPARALHGLLQGLDEAEMSLTHHHQGHRYLQLLRPGEVSQTTGPLCSCKNTRPALWIEHPWIGLFDCVTLHADQISFLERGGVSSARHASSLFPPPL